MATTAALVLAVAGCGWPQWGGGPEHRGSVPFSGGWGTTDIGTFWFAWTPPGDPTEYSFLPSAPSPTGAPSGWVDPVISGFPAYSIEFYNLSGSPIAPGNMATFQFTSSDSPTTLQGSTFGFPNTTSFIYQGFPLTGATAEVNPVFVAAPEPSSLILLALGCAGALWRRRATT